MLSRLVHGPLAAVSALHDPVAHALKHGGKAVSDKFFVVNDEYPERLHTAPRECPFDGIEATPKIRNYSVVDICNYHARTNYAKFQYVMS
jgi:hypothetical protein